MKPKYFTVHEANELLPFMNEELSRLQRIKGQFDMQYRRLTRLKSVNTNGAASTPEQEEQIFTLECELEFLQIEARTHVGNIGRTGGQLKDIDNGLIDFPAFIENREILLCWKQGEERVSHYHGIDEGFAGRQQIDWEGVDEHSDGQ